jgi:hypothetical protein
MVSRGEVELHVQGLFKRTEEMRHKFGTSVGGYMRWNSMLGENMDNEELG